MERIKNNTLSSAKLNNGFTIIEVALVLAIAGLIFLVVFLALPALQNSQKDTARRQDVGRVVSALQQYEADSGGNTSGLLPRGNNNEVYHADTPSSPGLLSGYLGKLSQTNAVQVYFGSYHKDPASDGTILVFGDRQCPSASDASSADPPSSFTSDPSTTAVSTTLSNDTVYCVNISMKIQPMLL